MENSIYIVKPGDSLWSIAQRFGTDVNTLARFNGIADPEMIMPETVLRIPTEPCNDSIRIHIVQKGDTLFDLAKQYGTTVEALAAANGIENPDILDIDQILRIPEGDEDIGSLTSYTVRPGDTLWKISQMTGVTVPQLININRISDPDSIYPGQVLRIR